MVEKPQGRRAGPHESERAVCYNPSREMKEVMRRRIAFLGALAIVGAGFAALGVFAVLARPPKFDAFINANITRPWLIVSFYAALLAVFVGIAYHALREE